METQQLQASSLEQSSDMRRPLSLVDLVIPQQVENLNPLEQFISTKFELLRFKSELIGNGASLESVALIFKCGDSELRDTAQALFSKRRYSDIMAALKQTKAWTREAHEKTDTTEGEKVLGELTSLDEKYGTCAKALQKNPHYVESLVKKLYNPDLSYSQRFEALQTISYLPIKKIGQREGFLALLKTAKEGIAPKSSSLKSGKTPEEIYFSRAVALSALCRWAERSKVGPASADDLQEVISINSKSTYRPCREYAEKLGKLLSR